MGRITGRVHLISTPEEVARLKVADPDKLALLRRPLSVSMIRAAVIEALKGRFPTIVGPDTKDNLLRNAKPTAGGAGPREDCRCCAGCRRTEQLKLESVARDCSGKRGSQLFDRRRPRAGSQLDRGRFGRRHHRRCFRPAELVEEVIARLREIAEVELSVLPGVTENVRFRMPSQLADHTG